MSWRELFGLPARLRERITIQHVVLTSDGIGGNTESWDTLASVYAEVEPLTGSAREQVIAAQREARNAYRIVIRKRSDITTPMRIQWQSKTLHIHGITHLRATTEILSYEGGEA